MTGNNKQDEPLATSFGDPFNGPDNVHVYPCFIISMLANMLISLIEYIFLFLQVAVFIFLAYRLKTMLLL